MVTEEKRVLGEVDNHLEDLPSVEEIAGWLRQGLSPLLVDIEGQNVFVVMPKAYQPGGEAPYFNSSGEVVVNMPGSDIHAGRASFEQVDISAEQMTEMSNRITKANERVYGEAEGD